MISVIVTAYHVNQHLLPYCVNGLMQQTVPFEPIFVFKTEDPVVTTRYAEPITKSVGNAKLLFTQPNDLHGNPERNLGLKHATGTYVMWLSVDNLVMPWWVETHQENIESRPGCVSIINTYHWGVDNGVNRLHGIFPGALSYGSVDLLNFALPRDLATRLDAFGALAGDQFASDWPVLQECMKHAPVVWDDSQVVAASHF